MDKDREFILAAMKDFYFFLADKLPVRQDNLFRTYLWLASLGVTLNILLWQHRLKPLLSPGAILSFISATISLIILFVCLYAMRGKQLLDCPDMLEYFKRLDDFDERQTIQQLAAQWWQIILREIKAKSLRGRLLKTTSWSLTFSFVCLAVATIFLMF